MRFGRMMRAAACGAAAGAAVLAVGLAGAPGAAAADPGKANMVDLSVSPTGGAGGSAPAAGADALTFSIHNAGPGDAAGPVEVDAVLVNTGAAGTGLPAGCAALGGSDTSGAPVVRCVLADPVSADGDADVSIPLAGSGSGGPEAWPGMLAMVHVSPARGSADVDTNPLNNNAMFTIG
jgi:hypothetical protein